MAWQASGIDAAAAAAAGLDASDVAGVAAAWAADRTDLACRGGG
jgi:hypothetical protein